MKMQGFIFLVEKGNMPKTAPHELHYEKLLSMTFEHSAGE